MKKLSYCLSAAQMNELEGLAYWVADDHYMREKFGNDDPELVSVRKSVETTFDACDRLKIPFWVQNAVVCFAENWRRYGKVHLSTYLRTRNITC